MQMYAEMKQHGASDEEIAEVQKLYDLLRPAVRVKPNGRVETAYGDKTWLGLYRTIASSVSFKHAD